MRVFLSTLAVMSAAIGVGYALRNVLNDEANAKPSQTDPKANNKPEESFTAFPDAGLATTISCLII